MKEFYNKHQVYHRARNHAGILIVCVLFLLAGLLSLDQVLVYTPDSARYLVWSQSLAHFEGYRDNTTPEPSKYVVHAPLYSLLLAPTEWISDPNVIPAKLLTTFIGIALIGAVYWWAGIRVGKRWALLLCSLLAVHPAMVLYSTQVLSDVPFAVCVLLFLSLIEREISPESKGGSRLIMLTAAIVCGLFLREVGLALIASCTMLLVLKRFYKEAFLILAVCIGFYVLWYIRNEVMVAGIEHPPLRNTQLFFRHLFTPSDVSILGEFVARLRTNAAIYGINIVQLPFLVETNLRGISTMAPNQFPISLSLWLMPYVYHFFLVFTLVVLIFGVSHEFRQRTRFKVLVVFLGFYVIPILLYPISDARFLFPPFIIVLYLIVAGFRFLVHLLALFLKNPKVIRWVTTAVFGFLALPNVAWTVTYIANNWRHERDPLGFYESMRNVPASPALFARPVDLAGRWVADHTDTSAVMISRWKELGVYAKGRRVLDVDPETLIDPFRDMLRDYGVQYIVTVVSRGGLREYEQLFAQSDRFHFNVAQRFGDLEIVKVEKGPADLSTEVSDHDSTEVGVRLRYARAIRELHNNRPTECERMLSALPAQVRRQSPVILNIGVAKEFAGNLDVANTTFEQFHNSQQAGSVVQPAWYHLEIISKLRNTMEHPPGIERAQGFHQVASYYWILGFRKESLLFLDKSIQADSSFFPSTIFRAIYSLLSGDTLKSKQFLELSRRIDPANVLVRDLSRILNNIRILAQRHDQNTDLAVRLDNVRQLNEMGLRENAIDGLLKILALYPNDEQCLRMLVDLYVQKARYAPALAHLKRLVALRPADVDLQKEMRELESRW